MFNISNSTKRDDIKVIFSLIDIIPTSLLFFFWACLCILSLAWSIYMLGRLIKERQHLKYIRGLRHSMHEDVWLMKVRNSKTKIVKNIFLFLISSTEWIGIFLIIISYLLNNIETFFKPIDSINPLAISNSPFALHAVYHSVQRRVFYTYSVVLFTLLPLILIRILTQYLCQQYTFYSKTSFSLKEKFKLPIAILIFLFLLCFIRQLIIFDWLAICVYFVYEFVVFTISSNCLCNLLYKRYFDARTHEYQPISIVRYYRCAYLEFKVCSCILVASLFLQMLSLILFVMFSLVGLALSSSSDLFQFLFQNAENLEAYSFLDRYQLQLKIFENACNSILMICICVAWGLLVLPYVLVSLKFCLNAVKTRVENNRDYPNHELIRRLIRNHHS